MEAFVVVSGAVCRFQGPVPGINWSYVSEKHLHRQWPANEKVNEFIQKAKPGDFIVVPEDFLIFKVVKNSERPVEVA